MVNFTMHEMAEKELYIVHIDDSNSLGRNKEWPRETTILSE